MQLMNGELVTQKAGADGWRQRTEQMNGTSVSGKTEATKNQYPPDHVGRLVIGRWRLVSMHAEVTTAVWFNLREAGDHFNRMALGLNMELIQNRLM